MKIAAITTCWNDPVFVPQFLRYYSPRVDQVFLIDNESTEETTVPAKEYPNVEVRSYSSGTTFDGWKKQEEMLKVKEECVGKFDYVFILDIDEYLVSKAGIPLKSHLQSCPQHKVLGTTGYNMYEFPGDSPYDPGQPILSQRKWGFENAHYSKPIIVRPEHPVKYPIGCHYLIDEPMPTIAPFHLLHYRAMSDEIFIERSLKFSTRMTEKEFRSGGGVYYWNVTRESLKERLKYEKSSGKPIRVLP